MTLRVDEAVAYRLKVLAAEERTSVTALVSEGINHVFEVRGAPAHCVNQELNPPSLWREEGLG